MGTELNRSGRYIAALLPINAMDFVVATTGTKLSAFGPVNGSSTITSTQVLNAAEKYTEARITDTPFEAHWLPRGAPKYQNFSGINGITVVSSSSLNDFSSTVDGTPTVTVSVAGSTGAPNAWNSANTDNGCELGQYAMVVMFDGDTTATATNTSNIYSFEICWNWEAIPRDPTTVSYSLTPSIADLVGYGKAMNAIEAAAVAHKTTGNKGLGF